MSVESTTSILNLAREAYRREKRDYFDGLLSIPLERCNQLLAERTHLLAVKVIKVMELNFKTLVLEIDNIEKKIVQLDCSQQDQKQVLAKKIESLKKQLNPFDISSKELLIEVLDGVVEIDSITHYDSIFKMLFFIATAKNFNQIDKEEIKKLSENFYFPEFKAILRV